MKYTEFICCNYIVVCGKIAEAFVRMKGILKMEHLEEISGFISNNYCVWYPHAMPFLNFFLFIFFFVFCFFCFFSF